MALIFDKTDILFEQRILACAGFYTASLDGKWGPKSEAAAQAFSQRYEADKVKFGAFDTRSEKNIATLLPAMQVKAREILGCAQHWASAGTTVSILSGTRTYAEQNVLFGKRPKVTNARGGQSNHNFGIAIDVGIFKGGKYLTGATRAEEKAYADLAASVKAELTRIDWGGDWKSFPDMPHYEYQTGMTITQKRVAFERGKLILE